MNTDGKGQEQITGNVEIIVFAREKIQFLSAYFWYQSVALTAQNMTEKINQRSYQTLARWAKSP
jgi:hypothetical protein